jgi:threonine-phosphate decarboxylase
MNFKHGGNIFYFSKELCKHEKEILDFSVNLNPLNFPEQIKNIIVNNIDKIYFYPEIYAQSLKQEIAKHFNISENNILIGNGSTQLIYLIPLALNIKKAVIINPTFSEYEYSLKRVGAKIINYNLSEKNNFKLNIDNFLKFASKTDAEAYYLCNPSNPSGSLINDDDIFFIAKFLRDKNKLFILDEAFIDFTDSNIEKTHFRKAYIKHASFENASLKGADFTDLRT